MRLIPRSPVLFTALALGLAATASAFGELIDISTGTGNAAWEVFDPSQGFVPATSLTTAEQNGTWAPPPTGSSWLSFGSDQGTSCVVGQTPGNGCASALSNPGGDTWQYTLNISAAQLGATSGSLDFLFGGDNSVSLFVGGGPGALNATSQFWNQGPGLGGFADLGCSATAGPTNAGNTQASYAGCTTALTFNSSFLNTDGSLTITGYVANAPIAGCPVCGDPTGFVVSGDITTTAPGRCRSRPASFWRPSPAWLVTLLIADAGSSSPNDRRGIASSRMKTRRAQRA